MYGMWKENPLVLAFVGDLHERKEIPTTPRVKPDDVVKHDGQVG